MKKLTLILAVALLLGGTAAFAGIDGSKHDLASDRSGWYQEICVYCHTPHAAKLDVPLWNRTWSTQTFSMYTSSTMNANPSATITDTVTGMCMSCHDGATGIVGAIVNTPNQWTLVTQNTSDTMTTVWGASAVSNLGTDLRNDHPVNVTYDSNNDTELDDAAPTIAKLFSNKVQCASCHDPHDNSNGPFLIASNVNSQICTDCHTK